MTANARRITAILYTFAWDGFSVRYADGRTESLSPKELLDRVGREEYDRLSKIAHEGDLTGHWHEVPAAAAYPEKMAGDQR